MSVRLFKTVLVITNIILIVLPIIGIILSYFFLVPRITDVSDTIDNETKLQTIAFALWGLVLVLTSICFIGVAFSRSITLHLIAALLLCCPLALGTWIVVEQFLFMQTPNWLVAGIAFTASLIWAIQVLTELILACALCCGACDKKDPEAQAIVDGDGNAADAEKVGGDDATQKETAEDGTDEEKEKLVIMQEQQAFVPSPQAPPIPEADEEPEEDEDEEEEQDSQANAPSPNPNHPQELPLHTIPEERQQLLPNMTVGGGGQSPRACPLATPEDTGV